MNLKELLEKRKTAITKKWFDTVVETYPSDTSRFLKKQKDPFDNPVGSTTLQGVEGMFDELLGNMDQEVITSFLDPIIRIRAVQAFSASKATGFIFFLKAIIRESIKDEIRQNQTDELLSIESRIDELGLIAFDIYMSCRETLFRIKAEEEKKRTFSAFERAGLIKEI
ncbi:RsbRD N-terminal domain-containing protein [Desulfobacterales bacterium HSG2]|nr:RsbRD N-terminal domain-containing protein [Desulfobacterales bacterium HSG2]